LRLEEACPRRRWCRKGQWGQRGGVGLRIVHVLLHVMDSFQPLVDWSGYGYAQLRVWQLRRRSCRREGRQPIKRCQRAAACMQCAERVGVRAQLGLGLLFSCGRLSPRHSSTAKRGSHLRHCIRPCGVCGGEGGAKGKGARATGPCNAPGLQLVRPPTPVKRMVDTAETLHEGWKPTRKTRRVSRRCGERFVGGFERWPGCTPAVVARACCGMSPGYGYGPS
jgi:hypothetical protein